MDDELEHDDDQAGDTAGITPGPALRAALEEAIAAQPAVDEAEPGTEAPPLVRARWIGQPVWNPEQGVIGYGDPIEVTEEQLGDEATLAIAWDEDWESDPELAAQAAAALGDGLDEHPEEG